MNTERPVTLETHKKAKENVRNANVVHKEFRTFNEQVLEKVSGLLGSPMVVYLFTLIAFIGLTQVTSLYQLIQWFSQTFVQFVALAVIQGYSNLQSKHDEAMAEMTFRLAKESERDIHHLIAHQDYQNEQLEKLTKALATKRKKTE